MPFRTTCPPPPPGAAAAETPREEEEEEKKRALKSDPGHLRSPGQRASEDGGEVGEASARTRPEPEGRVENTETTTFSDIGKQN